MVWDSVRGVVVLFGGLGSDDTLDDTWEWDGMSWTKRTPVTRPPGRRAHAMAFDRDRGVTVLFGGTDSDLSAFPQTHRGDTWEYDGTDWVETTPSTSPPARFKPALVYDELRQVTVLFSGGQQGIELNDTWEYDGVTWRQAAPSTSPPVRQGSCGFAWDPVRGEAVLYGDDGLSDPDATTWAYRAVE
jgi:hypothetical protein